MGKEYGQDDLLRSSLGLPLHRGILISFVFTVVSDLRGISFVSNLYNSTEVFPYNQREGASYIS